MSLIINKFYRDKSTQILLTPNILDRKNSMDRAMKKLNHRQPEKPPVTYFIRRNNEMLNKYKDG